MIFERSRKCGQGGDRGQGREIVVFYKTGGFVVGNFPVFLWFLARAADTDGGFAVAYGEGVSSHARKIAVDRTFDGINSRKDPYQCHDAKRNDEHREYGSEELSAYGSERYFYVFLKEGGQR